MIVLIGGRAGSTRVPGKNMRLVGGKTLIRRAVECACAAGARAYVSTDCDRIADAAVRAGAEAIMRPADLSTGLVDIRDWIDLAFDELDRREVEWSRCAFVAATSPFLRVEDLRAAFVALRLYDTALTVVPHPRSYFSGDVLDGRWVPHYTERPRTQELGIHVEAGSVFAFTRSHWLRQRTLVGGRCAAIVVPADTALDIDTEHDLALAQMMAANERGEEDA